MTALETLFVGANPSLFYASLGCIVGAILGWFLLKMILGNLMQNRFAAAQSQMTSGAFGHSLRGYGLEAHTQNNVIKESAGIINLADFAGYACMLVGVVGVVGVIVYLVQRFNVV